MPRSGKHRSVFTCQMCRMSQRKTTEMAKVWAAVRMLKQVLAGMTYVRPREYQIEPVLVAKARLVSEAAEEYLVIND